MLEQQSTKVTIGDAPERTSLKKKDRTKVPEDALNTRPKLNGYRMGHGN